MAGAAWVVEDMSLEDKKKKKKNIQQKGKKGRDGRGSQAHVARREDVGARGRERGERGGNERRDVPTKGLVLRNTRSPSLSPFPPHYPSTGRSRGGGGGGGGDDIFICSFKGSLLSPFKRKPSLSPSLSLAPSVSFFFFASRSPTMDSNRSFCTLPLPSRPRCLSTPSLGLSLHSAV